MLIGERSRLLWLIPFGVAAAYIAVFIVQLSHTLWVLNWNADYVSDFTIPTTTAATGTGDDTILGTSGGWFLLWIGMLTATLSSARSALATAGGKRPYDRGRGRSSGEAHLEHDGLAWLRDAGARHH